jgi:hypothetical protein
MLTATVKPTHNQPTAHPPLPPLPPQHRQPAEPRMSPLNAPNTAHLMPGEAVPDIVTACRLTQLGFMHRDYPLSGQPIAA